MKKLTLFECPIFKMNIIGIMPSTVSSAYTTYKDLDYKVLSHLSVLNTHVLQTEHFEFWSELCFGFPHHSFWNIHSKNSIDPTYSLWDMIEYCIVGFE